LSVNLAAWVHQLCDKPRCGQWAKLSSSAWMPVENARLVAGHNNKAPMGTSHALQERTIAPKDRTRLSVTQAPEKLLLARAPCHLR
jgi:hypothetical protein